MRLRPQGWPRSNRTIRNGELTKGRFARRGIMGVTTKSGRGATGIAPGRGHRRKAPMPTAQVTERRPTGHVRERGGKFYAKLRIPQPDGTAYEPQRLIGKVWTKRSRPPAGFSTRAQAQARLEAILAG